MLPKSSIIRIAKPTINLCEITRMYIEGLGFELLGEFNNHNGFDGRIIGHKNHCYHLEFTYHHNSQLLEKPHPDNLFVFYIEHQEQWESVCRSMESAGFIRVSSFNPYWDEKGQTYKDIDGNRIVIQNSEWSE